MRPMSAGHAQRHMHAHPSMQAMQGHVHAQPSMHAMHAGHAQRHMQEKACCQVQHACSSHETPNPCLPACMLPLPTQRAQTLPSFCNHTRETCAHAVQPQQLQLNQPQLIIPAPAHQPTQRKALDSSCRHHHRQCRRQWYTSLLYRTAKASGTPRTVQNSQGMVGPSTHCQDSCRTQHIMRAPAAAALSATHNTEALLRCTPCRCISD
jgi:hypothetical protein